MKKKDRFEVGGVRTELRVNLTNVKGVLRLGLGFVTSASSRFRSRIYFGFDNLTRLILRVAVGSKRATFLEPA